MLWTDKNAPRIWRSGCAGTGDDEALSDAAGCTDEVLARIADEGFTGVWLFCRLHDLMASTVFPELNQPRADERVAGIQAVVDRAARHGLGVYLYFNDPVGLDVDHPFWITHPDLKGVTKWHCYSLCTSTPEVQAFFRDAVASVLRRLPGAAGVILITACESLTHCWSKSNTRRGAPPPTCPRCVNREPADIVLELLEGWADARRRHAPSTRIIAWNWEWAYWYADPQAEIIGRLPAGVELMLDLEIGGTRQWLGRPNYIGEYSLSYVGPGQRFLASRALAASKGIPTHAKIQINSSHELCTVPNLPVLANLHGKLVALAEHGIAGFLGTWTIGCDLTLNTFAVKLFLRDPHRFADRQAFLDELAREYFGAAETDRVVRAWTQFGEAFSCYPFSVQMLYRGPHNDAPARRLSLHYEGTPVGRSFAPDPPGDDLSPCLHAAGVDQEAFTLYDVIEAYGRMCSAWDAALTDYEAGLAAPAPGTPEQVRHRAEELRCAQMLSVQFRSTLNVFRFYREQQRVMRERGLTAPCDLPRDPALLAVMSEEQANAERALPLVEADRRLGFHQEYQGYKYDAAMIREKLARMASELHCRIDRR